MLKIGTDYEIPENTAEQKEVARKNNIKIDNIATDREFNSKQITVKGNSWAPGDCKSDYQRYKQGKIMRASDPTMIPGLQCPDCFAQAFQTDHPKVAVCGDYPGWYFFYRRIDQDLRPGTKFVIKNGEIVEETDTVKEEASF